MRGVYNVEGVWVVCQCFVRCFVEWRCVNCAKRVILSQFAPLCVCLSKVVQDIWDIYWEELGTVPPDLIFALRSAFDANSVDEFWNVWSAGAEDGLVRAYHRAGGPLTSGIQAFLGRGIYTACLETPTWG